MTVNIRWMLTRAVALPLALVLGVAGGCASKKAPTAYQKASALTTPDTLKPNAVWAIVMLDSKDHILGSMVIKLTDTLVRTCDARNPRRAEVLSERPGDPSIPLRIDPVYVVEGAALRIDLVPSDLCDSDGYAIFGGVTEAGFEGLHIPEVMFPERRLETRRAFGVPLPSR